MAEPVVGIVGAKALRKDLGRLATDVNGPLYKAMAAAAKAAVEPVAAATRQNLPHSGRPDTQYHKAGALEKSVRTSGTRTGGAVRIGGALVPYAPWIEFGGSRPDGSTREFVQTGRYLFPAARSLSARAAADYSNALTRVFAQPGIWTNTTSDGSAVHD